MKVIQQICRLIIALTFIFSGFVKAVDPMGFAIKIEEYLISFGMELFSPVALPAAITLIAIEFLLGFFLLIKFHLRIMTLLTLITMCGFTLLTLYTALFDPVSDCGCFGDAIHLSNWGTFWKNVALMAPATGLFYFRKEFDDSKSNSFRMIATAFFAVVYIFCLQVYSYKNLPVIDFRPYKIGTNIAADMKTPEGAEQHEFETLFTMEKNGEIKIFSMDDYPYDDSTWVFIDSETRIVKTGYVPPLQDFSILNFDMDEVTSDIVNHRGPLFLMISQRLDKADKSSIKQLFELKTVAQQHHIPFYCVTSSDFQTAQRFDTENNVMFDYLQSDQTTLKTIVRSNPALLLLCDGTIVGKWHFNNIPDKEIMKNPLAYSVSESTKQHKKLTIWVNILLIIILSSMSINCKKNKK